MNDLVSVLMPVYNGEATIKRAIKSLELQTHKNWKAIIVDDGSTDQTRNILEEYKNDSRFKIIYHDKNKGRGAARQTALENAEGDFIAFLDADDFYHPEKLHKQVAIIGDYPELDLISCTSASYDNEYNLLTVRKKNDFVIKKYSISQPFKPSRAGSLVRLSAVSEYKYNLKLKYAEDTDFFARSIDGKFYAALPDILYYYSEFVSVTGVKILKTYYYAFIRTSFIFMQAPLKTMKNMGVIVLKFLVVSVGLPFFGVNYFLHKRGGKPTLKETTDFNNVIQLINGAK